MAEYRGLTVRIGADVSRFTQAIKATQGAIAATQKNLNDLKKALTLDPGNKNAAAMYVGELQSQAVAATSKVAELQRHITDLGNSIGKGPKGNYTTIGLLAEQTQNAALSAGRAKAAYNDVTDALAQVYTNISALSHETFDVSRESRNEMIEQLKETGVSAKDAREQVNQLISTYSQGKKFDVRNSSIQSIEAELNRLVNGEERLGLNGEVIRVGGVLDAEEAQKTLDTVKRLKVVWEQYSDRNDSARRVNELHNERVEVEKLNSQIKSLAQQMTQAADRSDLSKGLKASYDALSNLEKEAERTSQQFKVADEAFNLDPTNPEAAANRMHALGEALDAARARGEQLQNILQRYQDAGIDKVANGTKNLEQALADATEDANKANEAVIKLNSQLDQIETKRSNDTVDGSATIFGKIEDYQRLEQELSEAEATSAAATARMNELKDAVDFREKTAELSDVNNTVKDLENTLVGSAATFKAMADNMAKMYGNGLEQDLQGSKDVLANLSKESEQARSHLDQLDAAMRLDPSNMDKIAQRSLAIGTAMEATKAEAEQLRSIIDSYTAAGIDRVAQSTPNLTQALEDARKEFDSIMLDLATANSRGLGDEEVAQLRDRAAEAAKSMHELESAMNLNEARSRLQELANTSDELSNKADETAKHLKELAEAEVEVAAGGIETGFKNVVSDLEAMGQRSDDASSRFQALDRAMQVKPGSLDRVKARTDALREAVQSAKAKAEELDRQISNLKGQGLDMVASRTKNLATAVENARKKWDAAKTAVKTYEERLAEASRTSGKSADEIDKLEQQLNEARVAADKAGDSFRQFAGAQTLQELERMRTGVTETLTGFEEMGKTSLGGLATSTVMVLQEIGQYSRQAVDAVVDATTAIDDALTDVRKTVDGTEEQYQQLKDSAIESSKVQPIDAATIMEAEALGGQLGFDIDQVEEFARVATGLDVSTNMGWEDASTYMAQFFNVFQTKKDLVSNYGSTIVDLGNKFATTEQDIAMMSSRIASAGTSIGMSEADVLGLSAALSSMGVKAEAGGSSISTIMTNIDKSVALGTEGIKEYSERAGMTVSEFIGYLKSLDDDAFEEVAKSYGETSKQFEKNTLKSVESLEAWAAAAGKDSATFAKEWGEAPMQALIDVFTGLDEATDAGGNLALMLDELGISSIRQLDISRRMASNSNLVSEAVTTANKAWSDNIALDTEVARRNESLSAQMDIMANSFDAVKAELGEGLLPIVKTGVGFMQDFSHILDGMSDESKTATITVLGMSGAFATLWPIASKLFDVFKSGAVQIATFASNTMAGVGGLSSLITSFTGFLSTATLTPLTVGLSVGVLGLYAAYKGVIKPMMDAKKTADDFNSALKETRDTANGMKNVFGTGRGAIESFGGAAKKQAMSVRELADDLKAFNETISDLQTPVEDNASLLTEYQRVIDEFAGKGEASAEDLAKLEWAVNGINDALGTDYSAWDVLSNRYDGEAGQIDDLCSHIDRLIDKRKEEARVAAAQEIYTESLKKQYEYERNLATAEQDYMNALKDAREVDKYGRTDAQLIEDNIMGLGEAKQRLDAAREALGAVKQEVASAEELMTEATNATLNHADAIKSFVDSAYSGWDTEWQKALEDGGVTLDDFAQKAADAGLSIDDLKTIYSDPDIFFSDMVSQSIEDGIVNIDALIQKIQDYNNEHVEKKTFEVDTKQVSDAKLALDESKLDPAAKVTTEHYTTLTVDTAAGMKSTQVLTDAINAVPEKHDTTFTAFTTAFDQALGASKALLESFPLYQTIWMSLRVDTSDLASAEARVEQLKIKASKNAAGGIRYHADGMILNHPTWIGNRDIAGEAGAEAIIPLTNKRYVQPFANTVADGMLSKLDGLNVGGDTYNITVNAAGDTGDDIARAITRELRAYQLMRTGR